MQETTSKEQELLSQLIDAEYAYLQFIKQDSLAAFQRDTAGLVLNIFDPLSACFLRPDNDAALGEEVKAKEEQRRKVPPQEVKSQWKLVQLRLHPDQHQQHVDRATQNFVTVMQWMTTDNNWDRILTVSSLLQKQPTPSYLEVWEWIEREQKKDLDVKAEILDTSSKLAANEQAKASLWYAWRDPNRRKIWKDLFITPEKFLQEQLQRKEHLEKENHRLRRDLEILNGQLKMQGSVET